MSKNHDRKEKHQQEVLDSIKAELIKYGFPNKDNAIYSCEKIYDYGFNVSQTLDFSDYHQIINLLKTAKNNDANTKQTIFPDWICDNGLIEHFQVTATEDKKDGQELKKGIGTIENKLIKRNKDKKEFFDNELYEIPEQTKEKFIESFKKHWTEHIEKLHKYENNKNNVCFLIESDCFGIIQELNPDNKFIEGITSGNLDKHYSDQSNELFNSIMIGRCKELLEFIYQYKDDVQYVIFKSDNNYGEKVNIEIIKTEQANYIANLLRKYIYRDTSSENRSFIDIIHIKKNL